MKKQIIACALGLGMAFGAFASKNVGPGIGGMLCGNLNGLFWDVLGISINDTFWPVKFGAVTFGTSGASQPSRLVYEPTEKFIEENMDFVATDIAMGNGEYLDTIAVMLEVQDVDSFKAKAQANFDVIFPNAEVSAAEVTQNIVALL
ncbi:DUF3015 family protein [uncultured Treponema sp.]|uniref:DUF3015 family protein n=1 Tax=uncultured Treponema sp. TaxID=162155 RepID=UPI0025D802CD|nr:DUF3015 family protein [uncultured Treponema sp.]